MSSIIIHFFLFLFIIISNGLILFKLIFFKNLKLNSLETSILGLVATGFLAQLLNFFIPLNDMVIYCNLFISIVILTIYRKKIHLNLNKSITLVLLAMLFLCLAQIYSSGFSDDLAHYHGGQIINSDNSKYIIGINFLHHHYGYGSIWLLLHSYLNFNETFLQNIHVINAITLFLILSYLITECVKNDETNDNFLFILLGVFILFFLMKYTRLKEFGLDRPGILLFCFLIYLSFKYKNILETQQSAVINLTLIISLFLTGIKLFFIFSFIIPLFLMIKNKNNKFFLKKEFLVLFVFSLSYFGKNILWTGCLIYPLYFTCFSQLSWNSQDIAYKIMSTIEAHTKGFDSYKGSLSRLEYLQDYNWVKTWFGIVSEEFLTYFGLSAFIVVLMVASTKVIKSSSSLVWEKSILLMLFFSNLVLFLKTPVIRYHHTLFLLLTILFLVLPKIKFVRKKIIFFLIIAILFTFNLSKNLIRIHKNNYFNNPIQYLKKIKWYQEPRQKKLENFTYYNGWIGASPIGNENLDNYKYKKKFFDIIYK
ncbi:hypothetical protein OAA42_00735 [Pelagibacteraceae bacterium]|nr:hypothetical protein [Pelagibacteraceae bacterium]